MHRGLSADAPNRRLLTKRSCRQKVSTHGEYGSKLASMSLLAGYEVLNPSSLQCLDLHAPAVPGRWTRYTGRGTPIKLSSRALPPVAPVTRAGKTSRNLHRWPAGVTARPESAFCDANSGLPRNQV